MPNPVRTNRSPRRFLRVGLQSKMVLVLAFLVIAVTAAHGWLSYNTTRNFLIEGDLHHAGRLAEAIAAAARHDLRSERSTPLEQLVADYVRSDRVRCVALVDAEGTPVVSGCRDLLPDAWRGWIHLPASVSDTRYAEGDVLLLARPIVIRRDEGRDDLLGGVRLVMDTTATSARLAEVQRRTAVVAATIVVCGIPLGYLLVWRAIIQPIRKLAGASRHLGAGEYATRAEIHRSDEIGELAGAFDIMAEQIGEMRSELVAANERLEKKVAERTGDLALANERLREEMAEKEEFLRAVSHDLNAPLRNIAGMATMIMIKHRDAIPEEALARLQRIQANVDAESELIGELLELSRVKSRPEKRRTVDVRAMLRDLAESFEYELTRREIELSLPERAPELYVEPNRLRKVFQNLIDNAIKYMHRDEGGRIEVRYDAAEPGMHHFVIEDNGPGIPREQQKLIFGVFQRGNGNCAAGSKGVGLALVKTVVAKYDGRAWVESEPGEGSAFHLTLSAPTTRPPAESDGPANEWVSEHGASRSAAAP